MRALLLAACLLGSSPDAAPQRAAGAVTTTSTTPIPMRFDDAFIRARGEDLVARGEGVERPILAEWWFWGLVAAAAAGVVVTGVVLSSGGAFVPEGELGSSKTSDWGRF
ncbi:MAG: hypothetical protein KC933_04935 [Myxococcales bacterium]|nr:hypothetical protein [Myxococcales bacterium]MCB9649822.1 hypothetical protein [Deltaproteobacteria bacterium]